MSDFYKRFTRLSSHTHTHTTHRLLGQWKEVENKYCLFSGFIYKKRDEVVQALVAVPFYGIPLVLGHMTFPMGPSWLDLGPPLCHPIKEIPWPLVYAALCRFTGLVSFHPGEFTLLKSKLPRTQIQTLCPWYWETRADLHHQTMCLFFSVLGPQWKRRQQVWGKKKLFQVISVEKRIITILHLKYKL